MLGPTTILHNTSIRLFQAMAQEGNINKSQGLGSVGIEVMLRVHGLPDTLNPYGQVVILSS